MKVAISVPDTVFEAGEHLARQLGLSRSQLYASALSAYLSARGSEAVTAKLNAVYSSESSKLDPEFSHMLVTQLANEAW